MDASRQSAQSNSSNNEQVYGAHPASRTIGKGKGKDLSNSGTETVSGAGIEAGAGAISETGLIESIAASAKTVASTFDPRRTDVLRQHHTSGIGSFASSGTSSMSSSGSKATSSSAASRTFQHTANALETLANTSSTSAGSSSASNASGFRTTAGSGLSSSTSQQTGAEEAMMNWDSFLASADSDMIDNEPYKPPSISSFETSSLSYSQLPESHQLQPQLHQQSSLLSSPEMDQMFESVYQTHFSQPMNLTPSNHAVFLDYLKSTSSPSTITTETTPALHTSTLERAWPPFQSCQQQSFYQQQQSLPYHPTLNGTREFILSNDIQHQQRMDGSDVLTFLESTSYSDFVDQIESEGITKHQYDRRQFIYSEETLGPQTRSLFTTLQMIQNLPSERQDIVQYLLQQGTYADDIESQPFGHDVERQEGISLAATQQQQDQFLQRQQQQRSSDDATTEEMERVLNQIFQEAKTEVKDGETDGKALNRLMKVRRHIRMGTKL
ncbi:hypothetical protein BX616_003217 [Lobosporangium transversale]|uniref:Uncharacterized protein n=1 Tax=Lobosporangium transversale TaxID=64571 RepID=A0A1Y2GAJ7_9FUNG|nr:hypothetical protein BCR41DRAFT_425785 [Lobosporangium transversale]KAF9899157.1 hypothetical protein BX616_003217 [Lobosporangium transversale]ORZ04659.1 hypothetical protein BCR41DRAFT_425785 [Lobosporangium transversale]|eukprot:XP_021876656.1 hypothetical protein BCR41DRAFT_425785 [Lobosporangium transversale]